MGVLLSFFCTMNLALAVTDEIYTGIVPEGGLRINISGGSLVSIEYFVSSSGATASTRYRTVRYYIDQHSPDGTRKEFSFVPTVTSPPAGETIVDKITVTAQDLLDAGFPLSSLLEENLHKISRGAQIEIYNGSTVYRTIYNGWTSTVWPQIDQVGEDFGFGAQDVSDMKSRYSDTLIPSVIDPWDHLPTCSLDSGTIDSQEQKSNDWSVGYYTWEEHTSTAADGTESSYTSCDLTGHITGEYHEKLEMSIAEPDIPIVRAGQGTSVIVTTRYRNNDPDTWDSDSQTYTTGINSVKMTGPDTENWAQYKLTHPQITEDMVLQSSHVYYEYYMPESHSTGCNGGTFTVGHNTPVLEQTWVAPFARFDESTGWTRHQTMPTDIDNLNDVFGGLNRWYFGFDVPDNQSFSLRFMATGGAKYKGRSIMNTCGGTTITIKDGAYDSFIVRTVDPLNPFPGYTEGPISWKGFEEAITSLANWFREPEIEYQKKLEQWKTESWFGKILLAQ